MVFSRLRTTLLFWTVAATATADVVIDWNAAMTQFNEGEHPPMVAGSPPLELRAYAMAHIAMFNAAEEADKKHADARAAIAQAAHDVLVPLFPGGTAGFDSLLAQQLAALPDTPERSAGTAIGRQAAAAMLTARAHDGADRLEGPYKSDQKPGDYRITPPFDKMAPPGGAPPYAAYPGLIHVLPFVLKRADQFRAPPPYAVGDPEYVFEFNEVKAFGGAHSALRTADQTEMAQFWYEMSHFSWNRIARILAVQQGDTVLNNARLFAALNGAMSDALLAGWDSKYAHHFWRPVTAIHEAGRDENDLTEADPAWEPLLLTPPMPDYISTHSAMGAAASVVLIWFCHGDDRTFTVTGRMAAVVPGLHPRTFHRISDAAVENAESRIFAGIHFRLACLAGLHQGRDVGAWVVQHAPWTEGR